MAGPLKVKKAQAGDPGIGFVLEIPESMPNPLPNLTVHVIVSSASGSFAQTVVHVANPTNERRLVFIVPFGDVNYNNRIGQTYEVGIFAHYTDSFGNVMNMGGETQYLVASAGSFEFELGPPDEVTT